MLASDHTAHWKQTAGCSPGPLLLSQGPLHAVYSEGLHRALGEVRAKDGVKRTVDMGVWCKAQPGTPSPKHSHFSLYLKTRSL